MDTKMFEPRNSKEILDWYAHPKDADGQGVYVMFDTDGKCHWCKSGNELRRCHNLDPLRYMSGPVWLPLSVEDSNRLDEWFEKLCANW